MCRIEEKIYVGMDGRRRTFQDTFDCDRARRRGKRCSKPDIKTREYRTGPPTHGDDASSPASMNPPTPTGVGGYFIEERRPSASGGRRPSIKPTGSVKPEIIIQIGSNKERESKYPAKYLTKGYKRSSLGASSTASNEIAVDSPGSDASYTIPTGLPDTPILQNPPFGQQPGYAIRHAAPISKAHRHTASISSVTTSQTPSLSATSETEPDSPSAWHAPEYPRTIVHNPRVNLSPVDTARAQTAQQGSHRTGLGVPHNSSRDTSSSRDSAHDYLEVVSLYASSNVSNASSTPAAAPEITDRAADRARQRKKKQEEEQERRLDERLSQAAQAAQAAQAEAAEAKKEVRFAAAETGRYTDRERRRKEQSDRIHAEEQLRDRERQRKKDSEKHTVKETEKRATKKPDRQKTQPPTSFPQPQPSGSKGGRRSRRNSMTQADIEEQARLLRTEQLQMSLERTAAEQREHEEAMQLRFSMRQPNIVDAPTGVGSASRTGRRASIVDAPILPLTTDYGTRSQNTNVDSARERYTHYRPQPSSSQLPSARYSPSQLANPFGQPTRSSNSSMDENPFALPSNRPIHPSHPIRPVVHPSPYATGAAANAWDTRAMQASLTSQYPTGQATQYAAPAHARAQQATHNMNQAYQTHDEWRGD